MKTILLLTVFCITIAAAEIGATWKAPVHTDGLYRTPIVGYTPYLDGKPLPMVATTSNRFTVPDNGTFNFQVTASNTKSNGTLQEGLPSEPVEFSLVDGIYFGDVVPPGAPTGVKLAAVIINPHDLHPPPVAGGFVPTDIAGLALWLDASDANTLYDATSGGSLVAADGAVARWEDKSGNARHATNSTSAERALRKTSVANGRDVLRFDGTDDFMRVPDFTLTTASIFIVAKLSNGTGARNLMRKGFDGTTLEYVIRSDGDGVFSTFRNTTGPNLTNGGWGTTNFRLVATWADGTNSSLSVDNNTVVSSAFASSLLNGSTELRVGSSFTTGSNADPATQTWIGDMAEILIYSPSVTGEQRTNIQNYLKSKWGTP